MSECPVLGLQEGGVLGSSGRAVLLSKPLSRLGLWLHLLVPRGWALRRPPAPWTSNCSSWECAPFPSPASLATARRDTCMPRPSPGEGQHGMSGPWHSSCWTPPVQRQQRQGHWEIRPPSLVGPNHAETWGKSISERQAGI